MNARSGECRHVGTPHLFATRVYIPARRSLYKEHTPMITQDIVRKLWDEAGNGNIAIWSDERMTVVPPDYSGETAGKFILAMPANPSQSRPESDS